jgi:hypothetical protein
MPGSQVDLKSISKSNLVNPVQRSPQMQSKPHSIGCTSFSIQIDQSFGNSDLHHLIDIILNAQGCGSLGIDNLRTNRIPHQETLQVRKLLSLQHLNTSTAQL